jgi:hypothetical protein
VDLLLANLVGGFCPASFDNIINQKGPYGSSKVIGMQKFFLEYDTLMGALLVPSSRFWEPRMHKGENGKMPS